jgi:hypothetical protein
MGEMMKKFNQYAPLWKGPSTAEESIKMMMAVLERASIETGYAGAVLSQFGNDQWL